MAGRGPEAKSPETRARTNMPARGEWQDLPKSRPGPIPGLRKREKPWSARTREAWKAWWRDPAATQWTPADVENVHYLAEMYDLGSVALAGEMRLRMDRLGLTQTGKRDLRWRVAEVVESAPAVRPASRFEGLTLVTDDAVSA